MGQRDTSVWAVSRSQNFNMDIKLKVVHGEIIIDDRGYRGRLTVHCISSNCVQNRMENILRLEATNRRFNLELSTVLRKYFSSNSYLFHAVSILAQLMIQNYEALFKFIS